MAFKYICEGRWGENTIHYKTAEEGQDLGNGGKIGAKIQLEKTEMAVRLVEGALQLENWDLLKLLS